MNPNWLSRSKYGSKKIEIDGIIFASRKEAKYYEMFKEKKDKGEIKDFMIQVPYVLIPSQSEEITVFVKGKPVKKSKVVEREVKYIADFVVINHDETEEVYDVKGFPDQKYPIKRKLMRYVHGLVVQELK
jgi:hypothetical protein